MTDTPRPGLKELFVSAERRLEVAFYTSNIEKFLQARLVFEKYGLLLRHFRSKTEPYGEDYSLTKEELLARALREVLESVGRSSLFFVEDTSVRIDALSASGADYPGLRVKEWFETTSFLDLDRALANSTRAATVKSDIALHVPNLAKPVFFHGNTSGTVALTGAAFGQSPQYPWLTPDTFNGWFVPDGASRRLGEMSLEESWSHDFRVRSLVSLIARLEEYAAALNLPPQSYSRRRDVRVFAQPRLIPSEQRVFIVLGKTCAGKTTFGEYASMRLGLRFIEASGVVRMLRGESIDDGGELTPFEYAKRLLQDKGPDIVARKILQVLDPDIEQGSIISGFRTIEELQVIKDALPQTRVVFIEASERTRYQRQLQRKRAEFTQSLGGFRERDDEQRTFGLLRVAQDFADIRITNEGTLDEFHSQIASVVSPGRSHVAGVTRAVSPRHPGNGNQLYRCLHALSHANTPLTTEEIEAATRESGRIVLHNNANKVLRRVPELARRLELERTRVRYEITSAGRKYVDLMNLSLAAR